MAQENLNINIRAFNKTKGAFSSVTRALGGISKSVLNVKVGIAGLVGAAGFGALVKSTVQTNAKFQALEATLKTFLGTTEKASGAFAVLQEFAASTPFSVQEIVGSFNKMIALGLKPSIAALSDFGDIASGTGKSLSDFTEAAADAVQGEFERLKAFGIKANKEGETITFTFKGMQTSVKNDADLIQGYLQNLAKTEFAGATVEQAKTLNGAFSNLGDAVDFFQVKIGEGGLNKAVSDLAKGFSDLLRTSPELATNIGEVLGNAISTLTSKMKIGEGGIKQFAFQLSVKIAESIMSVLMSLQKASVGVVNFLNQFGAGLQSVDLSDLIFDMAEMAEASKRMAIAAGKEEGGAARSIEKLNEELQDLLPNIENVMPKLTEGQKALKAYAEASKDVQTNLESAALNGVQSLESSLVDVVMGAKSAKEAFKSMARSIVQDLIKIAIQKQITGAIAKFVGGVFGGGAAGGAPITASSGAATGGSVQRGVPKLVGEAGAEIFVPNQSGSIIPNKDIAGGGGITINQTIQVSTGVQQTVRNEIQSLMPQIANASKQAVLDARRRGGAFASAF